MTSKSQVLNSLKSKIKKARILDLVFFTVEDWYKNKQDCLDRIHNQLNTTNYIVRSSSRSEDQEQSSNSGKYESLLNVSRDNLPDAINQVVASYGEYADPQDEILIQPMLEDVVMSGVLFTRDPNTGAPYFIINYELEGDTTAVTSGASAGHTYVIARSCNALQDKRMLRLLDLAIELEALLGQPNLDIEFAYDNKKQLFLLQARPLIIKSLHKELEQHALLSKIKKKFLSLNAKHPYLYGSRTILGIMPDWNPAEIIGIRPKPLALSLYKELITDSIWAYQRDNYGYKNLRSFPLLIDLMGLPYIDVRVSFNSFIPKDLEAGLADKLVNYYLDRLEEEPFLHDKVEFDIVFSCHTFDLHKRAEKLKAYHFNDDEIGAIVTSLKNLTNNIIHRDQGLWIKDIEKIEELKIRHERICNNDTFDELTKIYWLIEECKRYGTLPFAGLARAGFIAVQLLNSMVAEGILSADERFCFLNSLDSVSTQMTRDMQQLDKQHFLQKYGHLRPGTYDILSPRYDEEPNLYFDWNKIKRMTSHQKDDFKLSLSQMRQIETLLDEQGIEHDVVGLFNFMKLAIEGREYAKFVFTKTLSDILSILKQFGLKNNIHVDEIAYMDIKDLLKHFSTSWDCIEELKRNIQVNIEKYKITNQIILPPLIVKPEDTEQFTLPESRPNFVTRKSLTAHVVSDLSDPEKMNGAIIFIPSADPGFDWVFTHQIAGFITAYGGVNSHMAIRAGELGLPAVIGTGDKLYNQLKSASRIHIDCGNQLVEVLH
ncbi:PEP/pyruvate-binding domain-containing protein [Legionella taurinensis]|uniref:Phosphoenolpyruvate synthase n=1 Tax=Legionella taurinensis TaxID=70611 RepID=A0A3A5LIM9_9GAMM|nr:PEP/pyruvate-binding domain-containing protein [Legionella taurinensis]RJT47775.1 phosphoenolpyruvate synthase [Legionella taurinensis]RJT67817.1 phosphoenolpyruvate synthase [Legionella taurinensis]STY25796.1 phosphoenolpyruvate synthase [Legionella taurinensis]